MIIITKLINIVKITLPSMRLAQNEFVR